MADEILVALKEQTERSILCLQNGRRIVDQSGKDCTAEILAEEMAFLAKLHNDTSEGSNG